MSESGSGSAESGSASSADSSAESPQGRVIEQRGLYAGELAVGDLYLHRPGRTLTESDNVLFTTLTMNPQALHLDAAFSATQPFGKPLVNSMLTLSTMVGLSVGQLTQGTLVAQLGLGDISFEKPVFAGDTLYASSEVVSIRASGSRPGQSVVVFALTGRNQNDDVVARASRTCLMHDAEPAGSGTGASFSGSAGTSSSGDSEGTMGS